MRDIRVALAQIAPKLGDVQANLTLHLDAVAQAAKDGARVLAFPELSLTGYVLRDQVPDVAIGQDDAVFAKLAAASSSIDLLVGLVEETPGHRFHNVAAYFSSGRLVHIHRKLYLPNYGMFQEGREFAAGERLRGFDAGYGPSGILICEDHWHPACAWLLAQGGAETLFTISSSPTRGARFEHEVTSVAVWERLLQVSAQFQTAFMIYANRVGCEDGLTFGGGSMVVDPFGRVIGSLPPLEEGLLAVDLEAEVLRRARTAYPLLRDENLDLVHRELERVRSERYELPGDENDDEGREQP